MQKPASQSKAPALQNLFLQTSLLSHCIVPQNQLHQKRRDTPVLRAQTVPDHKSPSLERRPMADTDFTSAAKDSSSAPNPSSVPKPLIYDLLNRLNASFARVHRNMAALEAVGIFDPLMMQVLNRQSEQLRAGANYHLLGAMRRIEERDRERFSQPHSEQNS
jgi:hypothetical protein